MIAILVCSLIMNAFFIFWIYAEKGEEARLNSLLTECMLEEY